VFAPVKVADDYYGDGTMLQLAPFSPALDLGARRILVVAAGKRRIDETACAQARDVPTLPQIAGHVLDRIFVDALEADLERLQRINDTLSGLPGPRRDAHAPRRVETLVVSPSRAVAPLAAAHSASLPPTLRLLMRCIGALRNEGASVLSWLLFERRYTRALMRLGFEDAMRRRNEVLRFLGDAAPHPKPHEPHEARLALESTRTP
jgi:NTE family protein